MTTATVTNQKTTFNADTNSDIPVKVTESSGAYIQHVNIETPTVAGSGQKTVTTAGTRVQLATTTAVASLTIKAKRTNTGSIYVGDSTVTSSTGFILAAGDSISLDISDLATIYLDSSVNAEGVSFLYVA